MLILSAKIKHYQTGFTMSSLDAIHVHHTLAFARCSSQIQTCCGSFVLTMSLSHGLANFVESSELCFRVLSRD